MNKIDCVVGLRVKGYNGQRGEIINIDELATTEYMSIKYDNGHIDKEVHYDEVTLIDPLLEIEYQIIMAKIQESANILNEAANYARKNGRSLEDLAFEGNIDLNIVQSIGSKFGWRISSLRC